MIRGIERRRIFRGADDRQLCIDRLGSLIIAGAGGLYAWCLMGNHVHALIRTGDTPLSILMRRWVGPYASEFNRRHGRCGHLFQNRYKSIVVEEERYLLELVRYIHLNPVRARLLSLDDLDAYRWTGHTVLLGRRDFPAQDTDSILSFFGETASVARRAYRNFVRTTPSQRLDLSGGGLHRSVAGWEHSPSLQKGREDWEHDERILGGSEFVRTLIEQSPRPHHREGDPRALVARLLPTVAARFGVTTSEIASRSLRHPVLAARAALCHLAVCRGRLSLTAVARCLDLSKQSVTRAVERAARLPEVADLERVLF